MTSPLSPVIAPALAAIPGLRHAFFTREGGVSGGIYASLNGGQGSRDAPEAVRSNRARMAAYFGAPVERLISVHQVHSAHCVALKAPFELDQRPQADAMASDQPGLVLAISTADCGPVLLVDPLARVIGAAHAGWRGALNGVLEATIEAMEGLGARRGAIVAALGPMLSQQNYEVGPEYEATFLAQSPDHARFFASGKRDGHPHFDLEGFIVHRLEQAGINAISPLSLCTYADEARFYSYRRMVHRGEPDYGRLIAAIMLAPEA